MKIFSSQQIKDWDTYSIREQNITSEALMERAALSCCHWLINNHFTQQPILVFCGKGNNGGDGLALARILIQSNVRVTVYILELGRAGTGDFQLNLQRLQQANGNIHFIQSEHFFPVIEKDQLVIDALFGTGLNKPLDGIALQLVEHLNNAHARVISIDMPSGLFCDKSTLGYAAIHAMHTLSFQAVKLAFLMPENDLFVGEFHILNIGLSRQYEDEETAVHEMIDTAIIRSIIKPRNKFSHKGSFGHAALISGSYGMMGAAVLAAKACMQAGTGKLTCHIPSCGYEIMQSSLPEAMCKVSGDKFITHVGNADEYDAIGIGPGIGQQKESIILVNEILISGNKQLVLDADALNTMAADKKLLEKIPPGIVITPHLKEFERMFGVATNDFERLELAITIASRLNIYIVLKGHYTAIITPLGKVYFNNTGNAGMAKAGMGDVLTGLITGLMSQQYPLPEAAMLGVHLHGLAGDIAFIKYSQQSMQASDLINCIGDAWKTFSM
ncbi:MAG: NAD(P)H-hydrate dehydratase [Ferruginibacter sp.]